MLLFHDPTIVLLLMFFGTPICLVVFFSLALKKYLQFKAQNRKAPGSVPDRAVKKQRNAMLLWGGIALVVIAMEIRLVLLLSSEVAYM
ncbi:MAG: hypothetical protein E7437_08830 [Ruminococcaceae bacterium]|nr:hypothetical protein [Oscillospiraceae bacterium]